MGYAGAGGHISAVYGGVTAVRQRLGRFGEVERIKGASIIEYKS